MGCQHHPKALSAKISNHGNTTLHIAILAGHINIVKELVNKMSKENLKIINISGYTVLSDWAQVGNIEMTEMRNWKELDLT